MSTRPRLPSSISDSSQHFSSPEHYLRIIWHRKWIVLAVFLGITLGTTAITSQLPDIFTSETVILVDPQKVPENYVKSTVTGDVRNRLSTLSQQILSATRLQKIIDSLNLYPEERQKLAREEVIMKMRADISVNVLGGAVSAPELQAFRVTYSGKEPRLVAQVTNQLAALFIEENLKAREQQATGTAEFLQNQLQETRRVLEAQEAKLKDFKLKHVGEMPEQQTATLQILGQLQAQLQIENEALSRAEQQKTYIQSMMATQSAPVVDLDEFEARPSAPREGPAPAKSPLATAKARLATLLNRYSEEHPEVRKLTKEIEEYETKERANGPTIAAAEPVKPVAAPKRPPVPARYVNPVLEGQLKTIESDIAKHKEERQRLARQIAAYQTRLEAIPVREQQMTELVRDYEMSKAHYSQLLEKQLSAETATQLEIRQKGERFSILDPAQPAEKASRPNRLLLNAAGSIAGLGLGLLFALVTELLGMSITAPEQITAATGIFVLEVIPVIRTRTDQIVQRRRMVMAGFSGLVLMLIAGGALLLYRYHTQGL